MNVKDEKERKESLNPCFCLSFISADKLNWPAIYY